VSAQNPYIQNFTTFDGLPSNAVHYIYQDSKKFIWFATDAGVSRYNGTSFTNYRNKDGLSSNDIIRIKEDSSGRIWFFNYNGDLDFCSQNKIFNRTNTPYLDSIKNKTFFIDFFQDKDKTIYFYNNEVEIYRLNPVNKVKKIELNTKLTRDQIKWPVRYGFLLRYLNKNSTNEFIVWVNGKVIKTDTWFKNPYVLFDSIEIWKVFPGRGNTIYFSSYGYGIYKVSGKSDIKHLLTPIRMPLGYQGINSILEDIKGFLWIVTFDNGVFCLNNNKVVRHFEIKQGQSMIEDNEHNLWISSLKDGVYKISPDMNAHLHYDKSSFQNKGITAMCAGPGWGLWLTNSKQLYLLKNNEFYTLNYPVVNSLVTQIVQLKNSTLIIGARGSYSCAFEGISLDYKMKQINYKTRIKAPVGFKKIVINNKEDKISAFSASTLYQFNSNILFHTRYEVNVGEHISNIFFNLNDELIINAKKNYQYKKDRIFPCNDLARFNNRSITDHLIMNDSAEIYNIDGDSIFLYYRNKFFNLTASFSAPIDLQVKKIIADGPELYLSTSRNIYKCDNPLSIISNQPLHLQLLDINFRNIQDIIVYSDSLCIASDDGLTIIPEAMMTHIPIHTPIPYIQSILVNDIEADLLSQSVILTGNKRIKVIFSSINYSSTPVIYSYKLEGADRDWSVGIGRIVVYQDLPPGNYIFKLKTSKPNSEWSKTIEYRIKIKTHIWLHPLFLTCLLILFLAMIFLAIIRRKNIQMKRREIDHQLITLEQKALQSMMNPHFIFNALGSIQNYLLQKKSGEAGLYLSQFARLIRQNLNAINAASINLEEEIDRLKNYLDLEKMRMENKFDYTIEVDEKVEADEIQIPSMIIQPVVENAIWHGIAALEDKGQINIRFKMKDEKSINVIVEDNGIGMKQSEVYSAKREQHLHLGMEMTRKRLELLGKKFSIKTAIEFSETFPGKPYPGTRVELVLPVGS